MGEIERRFINLKELRVKKVEGEPVTISGYSAKFNLLSEDLGGFREKIKPGAFKNALEKSDVRALIDHKSELIVGRKGVNLTLKEDDVGLFMELAEPLVRSPRFDQLVVDVDNGLITQQSFGFTLKSETWDEDKEAGTVTRTLNEIEELFDVSPVTYPAYPDTTVAKRSLEKFKIADTSVEIKSEEQEATLSADDMAEDELLQKRIEKYQRKYSK
jgi:HK97 family phage prohead protease